VGLSAAHRDEGQMDSQAVGTIIAAFIGGVVGLVAAILTTRQTRESERQRNELELRQTK
jgi:uncharacterized membrane-anchored protein YhcB (DUF1043 family)